VTSLVGALVVALGLVWNPAQASQQSVEPQTATPDLAAEFRSQDSNGDGGMTLAEFTAQGYDERAFRNADLDDNGLLSVEEYIKARSLQDRISAGEYIDDAWITTKVKAVLFKEDFLGGLEIGVETRGGVVQLSGWVEEPGQADKAGQVAAAVKGVKEVENDLLIKQ
jgi:hyperosmotically inducible protein